MSRLTLIVLVLFIAIGILALMIKPLRKAGGLTLIIVGAIVSLTGIGMLIGIPMILVGGVMLFV